MLGRSSLRQLHLEASRVAAEQLQFPFLCPILLRPSPAKRSTRRHVSTTSSHQSPRVQNLSQRKPVACSAQRHYNASRPKQVPHYEYAESYTSFGGADAYVPFETFSMTPARKLANVDGHGDAQFDPRSPLIVRDTANEGLPYMQTMKHDTTGHLNDLHTLIIACLQVGRLDRASTCLQRLGMIYRAEDPELIRIHNIYIGMLTERLTHSDDAELLSLLHSWYQREIVRKGIPPNAVTLSHLIHASLVEDYEPRCARMIRFYLSEAEQRGLLEDTCDQVVLSLSQAEVEKIKASSGDYLDAFPPDEVIQDITQNNDFQTRLPELENEEHNNEPNSQSRILQLTAAKMKGISLSTLKRSLGSLTGVADLPSNTENLTEEELYQVNLQRQLQLESDSLKSAMEKWRHDHQETLKRGGASSTLQWKTTGAIMWEWHQAMVPLIGEEIEACKATDLRDPQTTLEKSRARYGPFLQQLPADVLAATTILTVLRLMTGLHNHVPKGLAYYVTQIGGAVEQEKYADWLEREAKGKFSKLSQIARLTRIQSLLRWRDKLRDPTVLNFHEDMKDPDRPGQDINAQRWSSSLKAQVGACLLAFLLKVANYDYKVIENGKSVTKTEKAFVHGTQFRKSRSIGTLSFGKALGEHLTKDPVGIQFTKHLPMLVRPKPWTSYRNGGYQNTALQVVRTTEHATQIEYYIKCAIMNGDMNKIFKGLDILGAVPWKINKSVLDTMTKLWNTGDAVANIVSATAVPDIPPQPTDPKDLFAQKEWRHQVKKANARVAGLHSQRCSQNLQLEVAKAFADETFYVPHNLDFRGRAYPLPPYFNHMGPDHCRALLLFAEGRPLGERGLVWLKTHLANVFGYDKASLSERLAWADNHEKEILETADNPIDGSRWWLKGEDPWQCLATATEIANAVRSPDHTQYLSHLPVHQDGTCNGLQHYAALGGDPLGARQVNLEPGDRPSDIYTAVSDMVHERVVEDAKTGHAEAELLKDKITRKVVKQTVMTNVYGVTFQGAKLQVVRRLEELYPEIFVGQDKLVFTCGRYIATLIFEALGKIFNGARELQLWLGECGHRICSAITKEQIELLEAEAAGEVKPPRMRAPTKKYRLGDPSSFRSGIIWTTPLGMPVVQPYRKSAAITVKTHLQQVQIMQPGDGFPVHKSKQLQAFPPNFIHSLDATHMFLAALSCHEQGLTFASVHDSFWTHAADVDQMNTTIRDAFIRIHAEDVIGRLHTEFSARGEGSLYLAPISAKGELGAAVKKWRKNHEYPLKGMSTKEKQKHELLLEAKRLRLLKSDSAAERADGEKMITPGSIFAEMSEEKEILWTNTPNQRIGDINEDEAGAKPGQEVQTSLDGNFNDFESLMQPAELHEVDEAESEPHSNEYGEFAGTDSQAGVQTEAEAENVRRLNEMQVNPKADKMIKRKAGYKLNIWLPLTFPAPPAKGDFDVSRLKESKYFFS